MRSGAPQKELPIEAPKLSLDELNKMTNKFGSRSLIGDGSYCQVYYGKLTDEREAIIKKLDTSSLPEPDDEFTNQVGISVIYLHSYDKVDATMPGSSLNNICPHLLISYIQLGSWLESY